MTLHDRASRGFEAWGRFVYRRRWLALAISVLVTVASISLLPRLRYDNSTESLLLHNDPALQRYERFRDEFGQDQSLVVAIEAPRIFDLAFLDELAALHEELEREVPYLNDIVSLVNVRDTRADGDTLIVGELLDDWPQTAGDLERLRQRVFSNPLYLDWLINDEATLTSVVLEPQIHSTGSSGGDGLAGFDEDGPGNGGLDALSVEEMGALLATVDEVVERHSAPDFRIRVAGAEPVNVHLNRIVSRTAAMSIGGSLLVNALLLAVLFRRVSAVLIPLLVVFSALVTSLAAMVLLDIPMSVTNSILPRFLIVVGLCNAVHILTGVYQLSVDADDREAVIGRALGRSGLPVAMASLTTAGGVLAFASTELAQTVNLGISAALGAVLALVYCLVTLPACIALAPVRSKGAFGGRRVERLIQSLLTRIGEASAAHPGRVLLAAVVVVAVGASGLARLRFAQETLHWFPEQDPVRETTEFLDGELGGTLALEVLIDTGHENGLHEPDVLNRIDRATKYAESVDHGDIWVGKATSLVDIVKETHRALHGDDPAYYRIPQEEPLVAQELLLFENGGADDLADFVDPSFRVARMTLRVPYADGMLVSSLADEIGAGISEMMGSTASVDVTGLASLFGRSVSLVNVSMARSYVFALLIITPLMVLMIGHWQLGLLAMLPNLVPILLTLGLMGWLDMPLDNSTLLLGCVILGLAVDDTIHFMHGVRESIARGDGVKAAVHHTLRTTGPALLATTLVLTLGFLVGTFAYLSNVVNFALLAAFATATAFVADITVSPALVTLLVRPGARAT